MLVKDDPQSFRSYLEDSSNLKGGRADRVIIPQSAAEIPSILKDANSKKISVTISGAGTGQAGGRIPFGGMVLSTEKLNIIKKIVNLNEGGYVVTEPGVLIGDLKAACGKEGLFYTYDPTEQTAFTGGTIATNASGARSLRYGPTRKYVEALEIILADGSRLSLKRGDIRAKQRKLEFEAGGKRYKIRIPSYKMPATKSSAGYYAEDNMDLLDLFVGQEGTLGIIIEARLRLLRTPPSIFSCFAFFTSLREAWDFARSARDIGPLSIEYFDENCLELLRVKYANVPDESAAAVFFEDEIADGEDAALVKWEKILSGHGVSTGRTWAAMNEKNRRDFLEKRHFIPEQMNEMAKRSGFPKVSTDLAVPIEKNEVMMRFYSDRLQKSGLRHFIFGHIGDAHLHVNMLPSDRAGYEKAGKLRLEFVKKSISLGGTVSAEHGIGKTKREFLKLLYGEKGVREMLEVKKTFDPNLILGRGNIFAAR